MSSEEFDYLDDDDEKDEEEDDDEDDDDNDNVECDFNSDLDGHHINLMIMRRRIRIFKIERH